MNNIFEKHTFNICLSNACKGMPNSQLEVAKYYYEISKDYVESYAWDLARKYKKYYLARHFF